MSLSLAIAKDYLTVDYTAQDLVIAADLAGAQEYAERVTGTKLSSAAAIERLNGGVLGLRPSEQLPITAVSEVYDTESSTIIDATDYHLRKNAIYRDSRSRWDEGPVNRWRVTYTGGYTSAALPIGLEMIILDLVSRQYNARGGKSQQGAAGYGVSWNKLVDSDMMEKLQSYRVGSTLFG